MSIQGLGEGQFQILESQMEKWVNRNKYGRKVAPWRPVVNTIFWVLRTEAPWKDAPRNQSFAHPSTSVIFIKNTSLCWNCYLKMSTLKHQS